MLILLVLNTLSIHHHATPYFVLPLCSNVVTETKEIDSMFNSRNFMVCHDE